jgi:Predicted RNA-binding protein (consists of S1 domain and a Zn-ribbon domain)
MIKALLFEFIFLGQRLCLADKEHISGCGTYERNGYIYSTLAGVVKVVKEEKVFFTFIIIIILIFIYVYWTLFNNNDIKNNNVFIVIKKKGIKERIDLAGK